MAKRKSKIKTFNVCIKIDGKPIGCAKMRGKSKASVQRRFEKQWLKTKIKK